MSKVFQIVVRLVIWATLAGLIVLGVWRWSTARRPALWSRMRRRAGS